MRWYVPALILAASIVVQSPVASLHAQERALLAHKPAQPQSKITAARLPILFEPNRGQAAAPVRFLARGIGQSIFLSDTEAAFVLALPARDRSAKDGAGILRPERRDGIEALVLRMVFAGAGKAAGVKTRLSGEQPHTARINHVIGRDRGTWQTGMPSYDAVLYRDLYPGIDLRIGPGRGGSRLDFLVAPQADPRRIRLQFPTAERLSLDERGVLQIDLGGQRLRLSAPYLYQETRDGRRDLVAGGYVLGRNREVSLRIGRYDPRRPLVIDPTLDASAVLGGSGIERPDFSSFALAPSGDIWTTGVATSADFPVVGGQQAIRRGFSDAFLARFAANDLTLAFSTYFGGSNSDSGSGLAPLPDGGTFLVGSVSSSDLPVSPDAAQANPGSYDDAFVARFDAAGLPTYVTYLGGNDLENGRTVAIRGNNLFVAGETFSTNFATTPLVSGLPPLNVSRTDNTNPDSYVARLNIATGALDFAHYIGGSENDAILSLVVDNTGSLLGAGLTGSPDLPVRPSGSQSHRGDSDAFLFKLGSDDASLVYLQYIGGSSSDNAYSLTVDTANRTHVAGGTVSTDLQQINSIFGGTPSPSYGFYAAFSPTGQREQVTYVGPRPTSVQSIAVAPNDRIWITGRGSEVPPAPIISENVPNGSSDALIAALDAQGPWRFIGGGNSEMGYFVAAPSETTLIIAGRTTSADFPATNNYRNGMVGSEDIFVARLSLPQLGPDLRLVFTDSADPVAPGQSFSYQITAINNGDGVATGVSVSVDIPAGCAPAFPLPVGWSSSGATLSHALNDLAPGMASAALTLPLSCSQGGMVIAEARVQATQADADLSNNTASQTTTIGTADLLVLKTALANPVPAGQAAEFLIELRNTGLLPASGARLTDTWPAGCQPLMPPNPPCSLNGQTVTCMLGNPIPAGGLWAGLLRGTCMPGVHANTVEAIADTEPASQRGDNSATEVFIVEAPPAPMPGLTVALDIDPPEIQLGHRFGYKINLRNSGNAALSDVRLLASFRLDKVVRNIRLDDAGGGQCQPLAITTQEARLDCRFAALPVEQSRTLLLSAEAFGLGSVLASASAEAAGIPAPVIQTATRLVQAPPADLEVVMNAQGEAQVDGRLTHYVSLRNRGPEAAHSLRATITLPRDARIDYMPNTPQAGQCVEIPLLSPTRRQVECNLANLGAGQQIPIVLVLRPGSAGDFRVTAAVESGSILDPHAGNNQATLTTAIVP
jgi:uncharacterized repeat protein (TIGR01451 family)